MSTKGEGAALVGVGTVACAACCAGPIIGFLAAIGLGTAAGIALFGAFGLVLAAIGAFIVVRRRRRPSACGAEVAPVAVEMPVARSSAVGVGVGVGEVSVTH